MKQAVVIALLAFAHWGFAQTVPLPTRTTESIARIVGKAGTANPDGSYRINLPRTDIVFTNANKMPISADLGLATYIAFSGTEEKALAVGDVAMLEGEIDGVIDALRAGKIEVVALHNHMTAENPRLFYTHFQAVGDPLAIALTFKKAIAGLGKKTVSKPTTKSAPKQLDTAGLESILSVKPQVFPSGVARFATPRKDLSVSVDQQKFLPGMGLGSWVAFSPCLCGETMAMGDTCCLRSELQNAIDSLRAAKIHITAIHNHVFGASEEVMFMHFEAEGDSMQIAKAVRNCWDKLGKK